MAISIEEIQLEYAKIMHSKYSEQLKSFDDVFNSDGHLNGGMHIILSPGGVISFKPGFGSEGSHNISNSDARSILNIIRMSIAERKQKFEKYGRK